MRKGYWARLMRLAPIVLLAFCLLFAGCETNVAEMSSLPELSRPYAGEYECETLTLAGEDMLSAFRTVRLTLGYDGKALKAYRRPCGFPWQSLYLPELSS